MGLILGLSGSVWLRNRLFRRRQDLQMLVNERNDCTDRRKQDVRLRDSQFEISWVTEGHLGDISGGISSDIRSYQE